MLTFFKLFVNFVLSTFLQFLQIQNSNSFLRQSTKFIPSSYYKKRKPMMLSVL